MRKQSTCLATATAALAAAPVQAPTVAPVATPAPTIKARAPRVARAKFALHPTGDHVDVAPENTAASLAMAHAAGLRGIAWPVGMPGPVKLTEFPSFWARLIKACPGMNA